ncbi:hypothetical protein [Rhizobium laguerreae]|uniref:hypothetical protein n=1 Tax=Rhizobium laguerreae TaxID=1076926 RepID=UPI001C90C64C|nr:hypothetical protein [Rhizobium laguerreae]MBY3344891.1 hypothetical protein [Rhizobium laguerreae]MBY3351925.1 hypothetical protein [Rhizobium laguerreae]MBY3372598.1 hypothetical protein [Rhizobium laguerreae]MBY3427765.1 hypothetical protein [Rhizobium laguerreae]MBY3436775.1 hypothetical protein [Rhizobium laguerreae]
MQKFDKGAVMRMAWAIYRKRWVGARPANEAARRKSFGQCLKSAWMTVKYQAAEAVKTVQQRAADRIQELTAELMRVDARPWRVGIGTDRAEILTQIAFMERSA